MLTTWQFKINVKVYCFTPQSLQNLSWTDSNIPLQLWQRSVFEPELGFLLTGLATWFAPHSEQNLSVLNSRYSSQAWQRTRLGVNDDTLGSLAALWWDLGRRREGRIESRGKPGCNVDGMRLWNALRCVSTLCLVLASSSSSLIRD